eukprot:TRINITY_DN51183_c0_g1_i1.p1 TRINITY_DN51183_c0_g1~~TRINITY_DN51183_c0_g1_i1.p1  ORF type:complete len:201 (-),score=19.58 TRINITY_DN51183_c0_g1_i1:114-716(-)
MLRFLVSLLICCIVCDANNWEVNFNNGGCCNNNCANAGKCPAKANVLAAYQGFKDFSLDPVNNPFDSLPSLIFQYFSPSADIVVYSREGFPQVPWTGAFVGIQAWMTALVTSMVSINGGCFYTAFDIREVHHACEADGTGVGWARIFWDMTCAGGSFQHVETHTHVFKTNAAGLITYFELEYDERAVAGWPAILNTAPQQ